MKRFIFALSLSLFSLQISSAQNIAYEVIRTQEAPGYFALRVYPGNDLPPLNVETVLVENYDTTAERKQFKTLTNNLRNAGLQVLSSSEGAKLVGNGNYRLVLLGGPNQDRWLQFKPQNPDDMAAEFEMFSLTKLGPVYLSNIKAEFGGNVKQVRPDQVPFLDEQSTYFVGQFEKPMKTRVSLSGETPDITVQADGIMDLTTFREHEATGMLQTLWQDLTFTDTSPSQTPFVLDFKKLVTNSFPYLLALIGLGFMYIATRPSKLRTGMIDELDAIFWNTPIEETPIYQAWEKNFPWELTDAELKLTQ